MIWGEQLQALGVVALAMALGACVGLEREIAGKPAGLRTHILVAGAAAFFIALGDAMLTHFSATLGPEDVRGDPNRIIEAIVTGISFLGAGTIMRRDKDEQVEGLTTAASILFVAAIGVAVAIQQLVLAIGATALVLFVLRGLQRWDHWIQRRRPPA